MPPGWPPTTSAPVRRSPAACVSRRAGRQRSSSGRHRCSFRGVGRGVDGQPRVRRRGSACGAGPRRDCRDPVQPHVEHEPAVEVGLDQPQQVVAPGGGDDQVFQQVVRYRRDEQRPAVRGLDHVRRAGRRGLVVGVGCGSGRGDREAGGVVDDAGADRARYRHGLLQTVIDAGHISPQRVLMPPPTVRRCRGRRRTSGGGGDRTGVRPRRRHREPSCGDATTFDRTGSCVMVQDRSAGESRSRPDASRGFGPGPVVGRDRRRGPPRPSRPRSRDAAACAVSMAERAQLDLGDRRRASAARPGTKRTGASSRPAAARGWRRRSSRPPGRPVRSDRAGRRGSAAGRPGAAPRPSAYGGCPGRRATAARSRPAARRRPGRPATRRR